MEEGEFIFIFGLSGCGKIMFFLIIVGLFDLIDGIVFLDGELIIMKILFMGYML